MKLDLARLQPGARERAHVGERSGLEASQVEVGRPDSARVDFVDACTVETDAVQARLGEVQRADRAVDDEHIGHLGGWQRQVVDAHTPQGDGVPSHPQPGESADAATGDLDVPPRAVGRADLGRAQPCDCDIGQSGAGEVESGEGCLVEPALHEVRVRGARLGAGRAQTRTESLHPRCEHHLVVGHGGHVRRRRAWSPRTGRASGWGHAGQPRRRV